jgi:hypothetical protein
MKKKIIFLMFVFLTSFMCVIIGNKTNAAQYSTDLGKIANRVKQQNGRIDEWSLYTRESIDIKSQTEWAVKVSSLKKQFPQLVWIVDSKLGLATGTQKHNDYVETIKVMSTPKKDNSISYLIYEVKGHKWNKPVANNVDKSISNKLDVIYRDKPTIFSCIKGEFNDKIENVLLTETKHLLHAFQAKEKESLKEKDFYSISAYSSFFSGSIPTKNNRMNLQIGLRKTGLGAKTTFVIGTPIITIEY